MKNETFSILKLRAVKEQKEFDYTFSNKKLLLMLNALIHKDTVSRKIMSFLKNVMKLVKLN